MTVNLIKDQTNPLIDFPGLGIVAKVLIDDGTFEATLTLTGNNADQIFRNLTDIKELIGNYSESSFSSNTEKIPVYDRYENKGKIAKNNMDKLVLRKMIGYCIPYSNVSKKVSSDNNYSALFKNLKSGDESLKEKSQTLVFINGDVIADMFLNMNEYYLAPRPLLKLIHFEYIN